MTARDVPQSAGASRPGHWLEVLAAFTRLGLTSFGGPIAHLGYFREEFVARRQWLDDHAYADLVALCQFLPGPASSQVGMSIGLFRAGYLGALAAWLGFTLPSALLLLAFAYGTTAFSGPVGVAVIHGLKLVAVAIVAHAVWGMARALTLDRTRAGIAVAALFLVTLAGGAAGQVGAILLGGITGLLLCRGEPAAFAAPLPIAVPRLTGLACLVVFAGLFVGYALSLGGSKVYRATALVYPGTPLAAGGGQLPNLLGTPTAIRQLVTAEANVRRAASASGLRPAQVRSGTSVQQQAAAAERSIEPTLPGSCTSSISRLKSA